jgi:hypothetical protein
MKESFARFHLWARGAELLTTVLVGTWLMAAPVAAAPYERTYVVLSPSAARLSTTPHTGIETYYEWLVAGLATSRVTLTSVSVLQEPLGPNKSNSGGVKTPPKTDSPKPPPPWFGSGVDDPNRKVPPEGTPPNSGAPTSKDMKITRSEPVNFSGVATTSSDGQWGQGVAYDEASPGTSRIRFQYGSPERNAGGPWPSRIPQIVAVLEHLIDGAWREVDRFIGHEQVDGIDALEGYLGPGPHYYPPWPDVDAGLGSLYTRQDPWEGFQVQVGTGGETTPSIRPVNPIGIKRR